MPTVNITDTEINPSYEAAGGGGRKVLSDTEATATYTAEGGGGRRRLTDTEINPQRITEPAPGFAGLPPALGELLNF